MKKRVLVYFLIFFMLLTNFAMRPKVGALDKPLIDDEVELYLKIVCKADLKHSETEINSIGYPVHREWQDKFTATLKGTAKYKVEGNSSSKSKMEFHQVESDFKVTGSGGGSESGYETNHHERFTESGWEKKDFPSNYEGSWRYRLNTSKTDELVVEWVDIIPPEKGSSNPQYELYPVASYFIPYIEDSVNMSGTRKNNWLDFDGSHTDTQQYSQNALQGDAPSEAMYAYQLFWEKEGGIEFKGDLKPEGNKYTSSGSQSYSFTPEDGRNLSVDIYYEINRKPAPKYIQVNQAIGRYEYKSDDDFEPCEQFVAEKDTAIQVFLPKETPVNTISDIKLDIYRDGGKIAALSSFTRDNKNNAVTFIPKSRGEVGNWKEGTYKFDAKIGDKKYTLEDVEFVKSNKLRVLALPVKANYGGTIQVPGNQWMQGDSFLKQVYPIAYDKVEWKLGDLLDASDTKYDLTTEPGRHELALKLNSLQPESGEKYDIIIGFIESGIRIANGRILQGYTYGSPSNVVVNSDQDMLATVAHEIAHLYEVGDEYMGGSYNEDVNKPPYGYIGGDWVDNRITVIGTDINVKKSPYGEGTLISSKLLPFEVEGRKLLGDSISFMGSGAPQNKYWITPSIWEQLFYALGSPSSSSGKGNKMSWKIDTSDYEEDRVVLVSGQINSSGEINLALPFRNNQGTVEMTTDSEEYAINVVDEYGNVAASQGFNPIYNVNTNPPEPLDSPTFTNVPVYIPLGTVKLQIVKDDRVLKEISVSPNAPNVSIVSPSSGNQCSGEMAIEWKGSDPDGDKLYFTVEYSSDGVNWDVLDSGITQNKLVYDFKNLPGSDNGQIKVTASDGINNSFAVAQGLKIPYKEPKVFIQKPNIMHDSVILNGSAYDLGDGWLLDEDNLEWSSDRDGNLGGSSMLFLNNLSKGKHVITLKAVNSHGSISSDTITLDTESIPTEFDFEYKASTTINPGKDTKVDVTLKAVAPGKTGYTNVRLTFSAEGPGDVTIKAQEAGQVQNFTNEGVLGGKGFDVPADYKNTTQFTLSFPKAGTYNITFSLVDDKGNIVDNISSSKTFDVTTKVSLFSRIWAWWKGLWSGLGQKIDKIKSIIK